VLDQQPVPLIGVQKNIITPCTPLKNIGAAALNPLDGTGAAALKSHPSPLPAFALGRGYGLVYSTESSFLADFASLQFFGLVNYNYAPEDKRVTDQDLIFLPMQSILTGFSKADDATWDPVEIVSLAEVTFYLPALSSSSAPVECAEEVPLAPLTNATTVASASHRTPAGPTVSSCDPAPQRGKGGGGHSDGSKSYPEWLTAEATMSTYIARSFSLEGRERDHLFALLFSSAQHVLSIVYLIMIALFRFHSGLRMEPSVIQPDTKLLEALAMLSLSSIDAGCLK
jgi:hypothetical protein